MNRTIPTLITAGALALTLTACGAGPDDPVTDSQIHGVSKATAAVECQKHLADQTPGVSLGDFSAVSGNNIRQIRVGDDYHWHVSDSLDGRPYQCNVYPTADGIVTVEGTL